MPLRCAGSSPGPARSRLPVGGFERFSIKAQTNVVGGTIALTGANLELDGNPAEGVLTFATDGRQTLQGTLAADSIDLTPYLSAIRLLTDSERELDPRAAFARRLQRPRSSIFGFRPPRSRIGDRQARTHRHRGQCARRQTNIAIGEAQAFGGVIKGSLRFPTPPNRAWNFKSQLQFVGRRSGSTTSAELFGVGQTGRQRRPCLRLDGTGAQRAATDPHAQRHRDLDRAARAR